MTRAASLLAQARAVAALALHLRRERPDVVHTHTPIGGLVGRLAAALAGVPAVHTFHGLPLADPSRPTIIERAFLAAERVAARTTRRFLCQARGDVAAARALGIAHGDVVVIGNGVDLARFVPSPERRAAARAGLGIADEDLVLTTVARLVREKGLLELAAAAASLAGRPRLRFLVAGATLPSDRDGVEAALRQHAAAAALGGRWMLLGHRDDVPALLAATDIFVLPSYREGLPRSVIEAMASGVPIIASDIPACRELIEPEGSGLLVPPRDAGALARAITRLADDDAERARFGERSLALARERHDERRILEKQIALLREVVGAS